MNKFIRWYNQNVKQFWIGFGIIALAFIIIRTLNAIVGEENAQKRNNMKLQNSSTNTSTTISNSNTSVITGETVSNKETKTNEAIIKEFVGYCNNGEIEKAYNMLTDECKSLIYPSIQQFDQNYYKNIFYINRMYTMENWYKDTNLYTYYITYTEDVLATGNAQVADKKADYITIVKDQNGYKLNIASYIGRESCNKSLSKNNVTVLVNWLDMYMDYTIANITIQNNNTSTICLDSKKTEGTTYLYDENNVKYTGMLNEIAEEQLVVRRGMTNTINIKFNKIYNPERSIYGMIFADIVTNYEEYAQNLNNKKKMSMIIEM